MYPLKGERSSAKVPKRSSKKRWTTQWSYKISRNLSRMRCSEKWKLMESVVSRIYCLRSKKGRFPHLSSTLTRKGSPPETSSRTISSRLVTFLQRASQVSTLELSGIRQRLPWGKAGSDRKRLWPWSRTMLVRVFLLGKPLSIFLAGRRSFHLSNRKPVYLKRTPTSYPSTKIKMSLSFKKGMSKTRHLS